MNPYKIIYNYYPAGTLRDILVTHSKCVASKALDIADSLELEIDRDFVFEAAMLHDIGIFRTDAPSIHCYGSLPYICHGIEGRQILDEEGYPRHALVCERHTGAGITVGGITAQNLPLPRRDMCPVSLEEKLICYADKFFSKSRNLTEEKPVEKIIAQMEAHGADTLERFMQMHRLFCPECVAVR